MMLNILSCTYLLFVYLYQWHVWPLFCSLPNWNVVFQEFFGSDSSLAQALPAMEETQVRSLGQEYPLEKGMATHSSTLAWRIPRSENPGGLQSMGLQGVGHDWVTFTFKSSLHILDTSPLPDMWFANIIFPCVISTFISLTLSFTEQKFLILMRSNLSIFFLWHIRFDSTFKNSLPGPQSWRFYFYLFPKHF